MPDFDPSELLETTYAGDDFNSNFTPFPETECYARIKKIDARMITTKLGEKRVLADFTFVTDDENVKRETGMQEPQCRLSLWLDTKPNSAQLIDKKDNPNANVRLKRLARACGLPDGRKFRIADLDGLSCYIKTKHRADENDDENVFTDVTNYSAEPFRRVPRE